MNCLAEIYEIWNKEGKEHIKVRIESNKNKLHLGKISITQEKNIPRGSDDK